MHYYKFNISDYKSHTEHLDLLEDLAYRRMLDWCYLHESPLPKDKKDIGRLIRMRTHSECIASVLREFFDKDKDGNYINKRVFCEINKTNEKSSKARDAANSRWDKVSSNADALQSKCKRNATQDPLPITQDPLPKKKGAKRFAPPSLSEAQEYIGGKKYHVDAEQFIDFYESKGWMVGKNKMKDWKACVRTWEKRNKGNNNGSHQQTPKQSLGERATTARKQFEQSDDLEPMGETNPHLRS